MEKLSSGLGLTTIYISAYRSESGHKMISKLYRSIQEFSGESTSYIKERWEREGNFAMTIEEWENLNEKQWRSTNSLTWREFNWKNLVRFFITAALKHTEGQTDRLLERVWVKESKPSPYILGLLRDSKLLEVN